MRCLSLLVATVFHECMVIRIRKLYGLLFGIPDPDPYFRSGFGSDIPFPGRISDPNCFCLDPYQVCGVISSFPDPGPGSELSPVRIRGPATGLSHHRVGGGAVLQSMDVVKWNW